MRLRLHLWSLIVVAAVSVACMGDPPVGPSARPRPTSSPVGAATARPSATSTPAPGAAATATPVAPTPRPTVGPTATPEPGGPLQTGPVRFLALTVLSVRADDGTFRSGPYDNGQGSQAINLGEVATFDLTPKNAANQPCETIGEPTWIIEDDLDSSNREYLTVLSSNNPFLLRVRANGRTSGTAKVHLRAEVDGIPSNHLWVVVK